MGKQGLPCGDLPVHARTGLTALYVDSKGRAHFPIMGGDGTAERTAIAQLEAFDAETQTMRSQLLELGERGDLSEDETTRFNELAESYDARETAREPLATRVERMAKVREAWEAGGGEGAGDEHDEPIEPTSRSNGVTVTPGRPTRRTRVNPFKEYASTRSMPAGDVVTRARHSVEQAEDHVLSDDKRALVERALTESSRGGAELAHMIMAGQNPDYLSAFEKAALGRADRMTEAERAAVDFADQVARGIVEGNNSSGGFLVPPYFDPTIIHTAEDSTNPIRQLVSQRTITGPKYTVPTMGAVQAGYVGEAVEINESVPAFNSKTITVYKAGVYVKASTEALEDTGVGAEIAALTQEAKDEWEAQEQLLGDGAPGHITGILTALVAADAAAPSGSKLITATSSAGKYSADDLYALIGAVPARFRNNFKWLAEYAFYLRARTLAGNNNLGAFWTDLNGDNPPKIAGKPTYEASRFPTAMVNANYTANQLITVGGDFEKAYRIIDRRGMVVEFDPMVKGPNGRPTGERGWYATWRTGGDMILPRALRGLKSS